MKLSLRATLMAATVFASAPAVAQMTDNPMVGGAPMLAERNIVENAVNSADHTTLVAAVQAAGLVDTLQTEGPFTVFAPVNAAFDALPDGTVETLLMPENIDALTEVLTCHVLGANAMSDVIGGMIADGGGVHMVETLGGCMLEVRASNGMITLTDETGGTATVTIADVVQSNGVIHVIDAVLLPAADDAAMDEDMPMQTGMDAGDNPMVGGAPMFPSRNIVENAVNSADHTTLVAAVQAAGLVETLQSEGPFTVFAPTNMAFDALPDGTVETLLMEENRETLTKVLTSHVVAGNISAAQLTARARASSDGFYHFNAVSGAALSAQVRPSGDVYIFDESGNAYLVSVADVNQSNGVIHVVDGVLLPR
ncbi:fasciclin domain-containing protein [Roseinatronobacter sp. S2]|nr:fasciclin domain-containing protein [Roseinatronobacter sp. S2]